MHDLLGPSLAQQRLECAAQLLRRLEAPILAQVVLVEAIQRSGDVAFAEVKPVGTRLNAGDDFAVMKAAREEKLAKEAARAGR